MRSNSYIISLILTTLISKLPQFANSRTLEDIPFIHDGVISDRAIFFIESSSRGGLNARQACSVESAAKAHPNRPIYVFFTEAVKTENLKTEPITSLLDYTNINLVRLNVTKFSKNTPLEAVIKNQLQKSKHHIEHVSDLMRYLILYKFGGTYSDLDIVMVRSLDTLPQKTNWASKQFDEDEFENLAASIISVSKHGIGARVVNYTVNLLKDYFKPKEWSFNSIDVLFNALARICKIRDVEYMDAKRCHGFEILDINYFHSTPYLDYRELFDIEVNVSKLQAKIAKYNIYGFHMWNYMSKDTLIRKNSIYDHLAREFCPKTKLAYVTSTRVKRTKFTIIDKNLLPLRNTRLAILNTTNIGNYNNISRKVICNKPKLTIVKETVFVKNSKYVKHSKRILTFRRRAKLDLLTKVFVRPKVEV